MTELIIGPDFTVDDIHKVREYNYEVTRKMTREERRAYYSNAAEKARRRMRELKAER